MWEALLLSSVAFERARSSGLSILHSSEDPVLLVGRLLFACRKGVSGDACMPGCQKTPESCKQLHARWVRGLTAPSLWVSRAAWSWLASGLLGLISSRVCAKKQTWRLQFTPSLHSWVRYLRQEPAGCAAR